VCADEELVALTKSWSIVGKDLIKEVTCKEPYEWKETTGSEWEFAPAGEALAWRRPGGCLPVVSVCGCLL
jgi:carbamoyl-phosphate synthase small subunit